MSMLPFDVHRRLEMPKAVFLERAARQYSQRAGLNPDQSEAAAEALWNDGEALRDLDVSTPEEMADEDMSYWTNDEGAP